MNIYSAYETSKTLAEELGLDLSPIKAKWRGSTTNYWRQQVKRYSKNIKLRNTRFNRALKLSRETGVPLSLPPNTRGTDQNVWQREIRRIQGQQRRNLSQYRKAQQQRQQLTPILQQVNQILPKRRQQQRTKLIKQELNEEVAQRGFKQYKTNTKLLKNGLTIIKYVHRVPRSLRLRITETWLNEIRQQLYNILNIHRTHIGNNRVSLQVKDRRRYDKNIISTSYLLGVDNVLERIMADQIGPYTRGNDSGQEDNPFEIGEIIIKNIIKPENVMGSSSTRSIEQANNKWHIVNPKSKFNCVFQSVAVCRNFNTNKLLLNDTEEASSARIERGKQLKKKVKPSNDNYADNMTIQEICDWTRYPINLYNNVFELIKTFKPKNPLNRYKQKIKYYDIQKVGDHCKALISKKLIEHFHPDFEFKSLTKLEIIKSSNDTMIKKIKKFHKYNDKIASWDIETSLNVNNEHIPYASAIAWYEYEYGEDTVTFRNKKFIRKKKTEWKKVEERTKNITNRIIKEKQFWGLNCLQEMTTWIYENKEIFNGYTLYAHNGGKYDLPLAIKKAFIESPEFLIEGKGCVELNNAWIGFTLRARNDRKYKIYFRDSFRLLPMGLEKLTKELKVEHQKLTETVNHKDITLLNYNTFPELKKYLTHDVFGLLEVIQKFGSEVYKDLGIDITKCFTGASLSKINFFQNYYNTKYPVYKLSDDNDKFIRDSYFGGRVECFKMGHLLNKCYYYDFTSLYPDVGRLNLPYGEPEIIKLNKAKELPKDFFGWVECLVRTKNKKCIPKHCMISEDRLIFPVFENWTKINLFSEELDFNQYEYNFISGIKFKKAKFKKKFFNEGFVKKAESKKNNNPAMAQAYKIIINSGYGFWGLRTKDRDGVIICEPTSHEYLNYLNTDKLLSVREHNDYMFCRIKKDLDVKDYNVAVASAISSYARSKLHSLLTAIRKVGGHLYYCDTDSVICNININDYPEIKQKFQWDGNGSELGSLKNEADEYVEGVIKKVYSLSTELNTKPLFKELIKAYNERTERKQKAVFEELCNKEGGNFSWDEGVITGCKQYALKKTITLEGKEHTMEVVKLKGFSQKADKLKFDDMININKRVKMSQNQTQFRCPKSNYISETRSFTIKSKIVNKSFKRCYTKGQIFQDYILPLRV
jgi:hypothetical protein